MAGKLDQQTRSAFRHASRAAAAVGAASVQELVVRNPQDLALALKAYKGANISKLTLEDGGFTDADLQDLPSSLRELSVISAPGITAAGLAHLNNLPRLESLTVEGRQIGDEAARILAGNTTITSLNLAHNGIGDEGAQALAGNTSITTLDLHFNNIGAAGAQALAGNTSITTLNLRKNNIGTAGARALASNTSITTLRLGDNKIGWLGKRNLKAAMGHIPHLEF